MKKSIFMLLTLVVSLASCGQSTQNMSTVPSESTSSTTSSTDDSTTSTASNSTNDDSSSSSSSEETKIYFDQSFVNKKSAPTGWTYDGKIGTYSDGSLKLSADNLAVISPTIENPSISNVNVNVTFKYNANVTISSTSNLVFGIEGLNSSGEVIVTSYITPSSSYKNETTLALNLSASSTISKVRAIYKTKLSGVNIGLFHLKVYTGPLDENPDNPTPDPEPDPDPTPSNVITNKGKGISSYKNENGYYDVDFTKGQYAKDVTELAYYEGGCPTIGDVTVLVVPIEFSDKVHTSNQDLSALETALNGSLTNDKYSVKEFYKKSSYDQLNLNFEILGGGKTWYKPSQPSTYYINKMSQETNSTADVDAIFEVLSQVDGTVDFSKYDSDNNGNIDAIMAINTLDINYDAGIMNWAYRYWDLADNHILDNTYTWDYLWCPYNFLYETATGYDNGTDPTNTYTLIHEFGHVLGADDYYDTSYAGATPMAKNDVMDSGFGDHSPYTKFNYGWIKNSKLITTDSSVTLDLNAFSTSKETIMIANDFDETLGCYQEYWVLMYFEKEGGVNSKSNYEFDQGLVMYHIDASLVKETENSTTYYYVYNTNDSSGDYATGYYLTELMELTTTSYSLSTINKSSPSSFTDNSKNKIPYTFSINSMDSSKCNVTFTANK